MLRRARFLDKAHAPMHLQRVRGQFQRPFGQPALDHRDQEVGAGLPESGIITALGMRHIKAVAPNQQQRPHRLELAAHGGEKAQHIGVMQD